MCFLQYFFYSSICGFNNAIVFKDVDDDDIVYVENFIGTKLDVHLSNNESYHSKYSSCFFGCYSAQPSNFKFSLSEKWLVKQIVDYIDRLVESGENGGLSHFQYSPFETKIDAAIKSVPFFTKETSEIESKPPIAQPKEYEKSALLSKLCLQAAKNDSRDKHGHRFDDDVMNVASYWRMVCGKLGYESLQNNLQAALPSVSSTNRHISKTDGYVAEGVLRIGELQSYLKNRNLPQVVSLSEDATRITGRIQYDSKSNEILGFVLPLDKNTGMPVAHSYCARSANEILHHFSNNIPVANNVNVIMAQPLADVAPFCLMIYGSDSKYSAEDVINRYQVNYKLFHSKNYDDNKFVVHSRWNFVTDKLNEQNISVFTISSDSDPKFNSAMRKASLLGVKSAVIAAKWFKSGVKLNSKENQTFYVQDTPHIATKWRNGFLKTEKDKKKYPFGEKYFIQVDHVKYVMNNYPKDQHELTPTVFNSTDRQNYSSVLRLCDARVIALMKDHVPESNGTVAFLEILRNIIDAFRDVNLKPLQRVEKMWYSVFVLRFWREFVSSTKNFTLERNFMTLNCYSCIEMNAHSLLLILMHLKDINKPHLFMTYLFESQPCESFFRQVRSFTSTYSTVVNCSVKEILTRIKKIQLQNDIANKSVFKFPRIKILNEIVGDTIELPTKKEIINQVEQSKRKAIEFAIEIGLINKRKAKSFSLECKIPPIHPKPPILRESICKRELPAPLEIKSMNLKNFSDKFKGHAIPENSPYVRIFIDEKEFVLKKTSLCWLLRTEYTKLSSDRLMRVRATAQQPK